MKKELSAQAMRRRKRGGVIASQTLITLLTTIFVLLLIYAAYLTLRSVIPDAHRRARVAAIYALFSFLTVPFLVFIIPRFYFSLHPAPVINGSGSIDMDPVMLKTLLASLLDMTLIYIAVLYHRVNSERGVHHET